MRKTELVFQGEKHAGLDSKEEEEEEEAYLEPSFEHR